MNHIKTNFLGTSGELPSIIFVTVFGRPPRTDLHVIAQHQLFGIRIQIHLLVYPLGHRVPVQVMLEQRQRHDQRQQPLPVVLDEAQEFLFIITAEVVRQESIRR
jgi:hypothetical protein